MGKKGRLVVLVGLVLFLTDDSRMRPCFCLWDCLGTYFSIVCEPRESRRYLDTSSLLIIGHCSHISIPRLLEYFIICTEVPLHVLLHTHTHSNYSQAHLDYGSLGVRNLVRGQIDRALSTRLAPRTQCPVNFYSGLNTKSSAQ